MKEQYIPAPLKSAVKGGYVTDTSELLDKTKNKRQNVINQETDNEISGIKGGSTKSIADLSEDIANEVERASGIEAGLRESIDELGQIGLDPENAISTDGDDFDGDTTAKRSKIPTIGAIIDGNPGVYDVSKRNPTGGPNSDGKFTLEYILENADTLIPTSRRHGGMEICFVHTSDNKYVQYRLMSDTFNTTPANWQSIESAINTTNGYFVCDTVAGNSNKSVNIPGYKLQTGGSIKIKFEHATTGSPVNLNISGTGLKPLYYNGRIATNKNTWDDNEVVEVYYDGENYYANSLINKAKELAANMSYYVCSTAENNQNKSVTDLRFNLIVGGCFKVKFEHVVGNTVDVNFDFNSVAEYRKPLYYKGARASRDNSWEAGEVVEIYYDGEKYLANKYDISSDIAKINTELDSLGKAIDHIHSNKVVSTAGSAYTNIINNIKASAGQIIEVSFVNGISPSYKPVDFYIKYVGANSYTYIKAFPVTSGNQIVLKLDNGITDIKVTADAQNVTYSGETTLQIKILSKPFSDAHDLVENVFKVSEDITPQFVGYTNRALYANIPAGKRVIFKVIDPDNALNDVDVSFYKTRNVSSEPVATIKPNSVSNVITLTDTVEWLYASFQQATGVSYGTGRVTFEIHVESEQSDTIYHKLQDLENNGGSVSDSSDWIISIENPYFCPSYRGSADSVLNRTIGGLHVKFDNITFYNGGYRIIKTMTDVFTDTNKSAETSGEYVSGCLPLGTYGSYHQALAFDKETKKFKITTDTIDATGKFIYLAYAKDGKWCGEICRQFDSIKENNESVFLKQVRRNYLNTFRDKEVELLGARDCFTFGLCSDVHYSIFGDNGDSINVTNAVMAEIDRYIGLDAIINGGDNILYGSLFKRHGLDALRQEFQLIDLDKFIPCVGNHDYNGHGTPYTQKKDWTITDKELETLYFRRCKAINRPDGKLYYYRDFDEKKVRVVVLNTQDVPIQFNNEDELVYDPIEIFGISQTQINFIVSALDLSGKQSPSDWKIMFVMHVGLYSNEEGMMGNGTLINRAVVRNILKAFVNRSTYSYSETDTDYNGIFTVAGSVDFTNSDGKLVGVFNGHTHHDLYVDTDGFNCIGIQCSYPTTEHEETAYSLPSMPPMTYREFAIDAVILDDVRQKIVLKRFGCHHAIQNPDGDREYSYDVNI